MKIHIHTHTHTRSFVDRHINIFIYAHKNIYTHIERFTDYLLRKCLGGPDIK